MGSGESFQEILSTLFSARITEIGNATIFGYHALQSVVGASLLEGIDSQDNYYYIFHASTPSVQTTTNAFMSNDPIMMIPN